VIIINNGEIIASDSVANLHSRRGTAETMRLGVTGGNPQEIRKRIEQVAGVASVISLDGMAAREGLASFEVHGLADREVGPDLARAVVTAGWNLHELRIVGESLEEIFIELTKSERVQTGTAGTEIAAASEDKPEEVKE